MRKCRCDPAIADWIFESAALAVFEVFVQHLVAADVVIPDIGGEAFEVFVGIDPDLAGDGIVGYLFHHVAGAGTLVFDLGIVQ